MKNNIKTDRFCLGDIVCWFTKSEEDKIWYYGSIIYRYCEEVKLEAFLKKNKYTSYENDSKELKQFFVNEVKEMKTGEIWVLDDRYIVTVLHVKMSKA